MIGTYTCVVAILALLAVSGLYVGVTNDAVNFLNSAIGSKAAKMRTIYRYHYRCYDLKRYDGGGA